MHFLRLMRLKQQFLNSQVNYVYHTYEEPMLATIEALLPLLLAILKEAPHVIANIENIWKLATATTAPTADEQKTYDDALEAAHKELQAP